MALLIRHVAANDPDFAFCFRIRVDVFVHEQNVPVEEERDEHDPAALHFLAVREDGVAAGTARVLFKPFGVAKIGRVAVVKAARGLGFGAALIAAVEAELPLARSFALDAQVAALPFYERLGYAATGPEFMEAGIAHRHMVKPAASAASAAAPGPP